MAKNGKGGSKADRLIAAAEKAEAKRTANLVNKEGEVIMTQEVNPNPDPEPDKIEQPEGSAAEGNDGAADPDDEDEDEDDDDAPVPGKEPIARLSAEQVYGISQEVIDAAITAGDLRYFGTKAVKVGKNSKKSGGNQEYGVYEKYEAITFDGAKLLSKDLILGVPVAGKKRYDKGLWDFFNYGFDLEMKRPLRRMILKEMAGPDKLIAETVKLMLANKMKNPLTQELYTAETALEAITGSRRDAGMRV